MSNRLNLNWKLEWRDERAEFARTYLASIPFAPSVDELDLIGRYILWGKDRQSGLNGRQEGLELETASKTWDSHQPESLEALLEAPGFNENSILSEDSTPLRIPKETFSRQEASHNASPIALTALNDLWSQIDRLELVTSFYDLLHGRRTAPIRQPLLDRFTQSDLDAAREAATHLNSFSYLKKRHQLIELRREQYTIRDSYAPIPIPKDDPLIIKPVYPTFGDEIDIKPFGIQDASLLSQKIFNANRFPVPDDFSEEDLKAISSKLWTEGAPSTGHFIFDFTNPDHLYELYGMYEELKAMAADLGDSVSEKSTVREFLKTAAVYRRLARLEPIHKDILKMKVHKKTNQEIADFINKKYGKSYKVNYISTLYCKKCLENIAQAARDHREIMENIFFKENFKKCKDCGQVLLLNEKNFVKRKRSTDGFSPRCKRCEKILRDSKKVEVK